MRLLFACSLGGAGHLNPQLPFLEAAQGRGDQVLVVGPPAMAPMVKRAGYPFHEGGEPPEELIAPIRERLPLAPPHEASVLGNRDLFGRLAADAMLPTMEEVCRTWDPHVILRDPCEYASAVVARGLDIPHAQVAISLATAEAGSIISAAPALERHRASLPAELMASPYLTRFPASFDPSPFATTLRYRDPPNDGGPPLRDWWAGSDAPLVYLTFGTVLGYMSIASEVYRLALDAVAGLAVRVLLTVGRQFDPAELGTPPPNVHIEPWVDQAAALQEASLVVCHGGSGTVLGTLAAGVPLVVVPVFADQFENAQRVMDCGAGSVVGTDTAGTKGGRHLLRLEDAPRVTAAIEGALSSESYRAGAQAVAAEMTAAPGCEDVLTTLVGRLR